MQHGYISYRLLHPRTSISLPLALLKSTSLLPNYSSFHVRLYSKAKYFRSNERPFGDVVSQARSAVKRNRIKTKHLWDPESAADFDTILNTREVDPAIEAYRKLGKLLSSYQVQRYLNLIDDSLSNHDQTVLSKAVLRVCSDLIGGVIEFDSVAVEKLLFYLRRFKRHSAAKKLWDWANSREETLTMGAYVAALQLLADSSINENIDVLESIYRRALSADAGVFAEYHLSHNAVSDYKAMSDSQNSGTLAYGLHPRCIHLLAAIARARLLHGNWKDGYLAFDSACRLSSSRPKFFYEAMLDPGRQRPLSETYRVARLACRESIKLSPWKLDLLFGELSNKTTKPIRNNDDLLRTLKFVKASVNLLLAELDVGGEVWDGHMNKVLSTLMHLIHREGAISNSNAPGWSEFSQSIAKCGARLLEKVTPFMKPPAQQPHQVVMKLAIEARDYKLFYGTLQTLFSLGGSATPDLARILLEAAGFFGKTANIQDAWNEVVKTKQDLNLALAPRDFESLARAAHEQSCEKAIEFLNDETKRHGYEHNNEQVGSKLDTQSSAKDYSSTNLDLAGAQTIITDIFEFAVHSIDQISSKTSEEPILNHKSIGMSIDFRPLGDEIDLWKIYEEVSVDLETRKSPNYNPISHHELSLEEHSRLRNHFLDWVTVTELMADAEENEAQSKLSELNHDVGNSNTTSGEITMPVTLEGPPRFSSFEALREYVWRLRGKVDSL
jgi:hypothetical protein